MTFDRRVIVAEDAATLAAKVAAKFISKVRSSIRKHGTAGVVLTGGTMGSAVLAAVNASPDRDTVDWSKVDFWWGDERWVPRGHPDRNDVQSGEALLNHIPVDRNRVHHLPASDDGLDLEVAADAYAAELVAAAPEGESLPRFDILLLGVGPDGHIASLFPERSGIRERDLTVIPVRNSPKPPPERLSLTLPVINSAERVWMVLTGPDKASVIGLALAGAGSDQVPVAGARGKRRTAFWIDEAAASEVPENLIYPEY